MNVRDAATIVDINENLVSGKWVGEDRVWFEGHAKNLENRYQENFSRLVARAEGFIDGYKEGAGIYANKNLHSR